MFGFGVVLYCVYDDGIGVKFVWCILCVSYVWYVFCLFDIIFDIVVLR